jgi:nucleotide-binding universal stress UspA family protein
MTSEQRPVVVGVDGSDGSDTAVGWAVAEARARRVPLRLVHVFRWPPNYGPTPMYAGWPERDPLEIKQYAEQLVGNALRLARTVDPDLEVTAESIEGQRVPRLVEESGRASVLVLGSRRLHTVGSVLLGSVGAGVAARARCPVVVVRGPAGEPAEHASVVVGVDGEATSQDLLAYAFDHASRHGVALRAVLCWHPNRAEAAHWLQDAYNQARTRAEAWLAETLAGWREKYPEVPVHGVVVDDHAASALVDESAAGHLLVVGARGRHALAGTLLGSTSQGVLHHATCPVAVVPRGH